MSESSSNIHCACTAELLQALYQSLKMGSDAMVSLLPKVRSAPLRETITAELNRYEELAKAIADRLYGDGQTPEEKPWTAKLSAKLGMAMNTVMDSTDSHLAQMMIEGATMGITENTKLLRQYESTNCSEQSLSLAKKTVRLMENTVERMKAYL